MDASMLAVMNDLTRLKGVQIYQQSKQPCSEIYISMYFFNTSKISENLRDNRNKL